jgi:cephalosporin-C deacetylase
MSDKFPHDYAFDPSYGFDENALLEVSPGEAPEDFPEFWKDKYQQSLEITPYLSLQDTGQVHNHWRVFDCYYNSTNGMRIGGWLLLPTDGPVNGALISAHGYGGIDTPDTSWRLQNTALLFPVVRGMGRSAKPPISSEPQWHVQHNIQDKHQYIIGGCVQDLWCGVSALLSLFPQIVGRIGLIGSSLGGGLGIFACGFDARIRRCHFHLPTFGNTKLRMGLPTRGSTQALRELAKTSPDLIAATMPYFDASCAARYLTQPSYWALALFDPFVAPPGQFSAYNACPSQKQYHLLKAGHFVYLGQGRQLRDLRRELERFFATLGSPHAS